MSFKPLLRLLVFCFLWQLISGLGLAFAECPNLKCSPASFDLFFALFSEDIEFQRAVTNYPLKITVYSTTEPEIVEYELSSEKELKGNNSYLFPSRQERLKNNLFLHTEHYFSDSPGEAKAAYGRESTGYSVVYVFKWDGCWRLVEIHDHSSI